MPTATVATTGRAPWRSTSPANSGRPETVSSAPYPSLDAVLGGPTGRGRLILGDQGDRVAAGGPGDSTFILHALLARDPGLRAVVPVADAAAVERCLAAGPGASLTLTLGGRTSTVAPPVTATGRVLTAGPGASLVVRGPHDAGRRTAIGAYAVFEVGQVRVALTARPNAFVDPEYFRAMGLDLEASDVIVTRSGYHYSLNFGDMGTCVTVDSPGMTSYRVDELPFTVARPFHPLDPVAFEPRLLVRGRAFGTGSA